MAALDQDQVRSIDQIRQRLLTLRASLEQMQGNLGDEVRLRNQQPLPPWSALQSHANLISNNLHTIATQLAEHQQLLSSTYTFPLPQYPGKHQGHIIEQLLRTKLEPDVEEWVEQGQNIAKERSTIQSLPESARNELWQWAPSAANAEARKEKWGADYTRVEKITGIENVVTGLKRELVEPPDDIDEDEDEDDDYDEISDGEGGADGDKMDVEQQDKPSGGAIIDGSDALAGSSGPQMPLETIHRFMTTGKVG